MNRKTFLRLLGIGSVAAVVVPKLIAITPEAKPKGAIIIDKLPAGMSVKDFAQEWKKYNGQIIYRDHSPVMYLGEEKYKQFDEACREFLQSGLIDTEEYINSTIGQFRGMRVIMHPALPPDACIKVNSYYPGSIEWFNSVAMASL